MLPTVLPKLQRLVGVRQCRLLVSIRSRRLQTSVKATKLPSLPLTLERSIGDQAGTDVELRKTAVFQAEVFPDLPAATTWNKLISWNPKFNVPLDKAEVTVSVQNAFSSAASRVVTVAAQLRGKAQLRQRLIEAAQGILPTTSAAAAINESPSTSALLLVSGTHPFRTLPLTSRFLPSSLDLLKLAGNLQKEGQLGGSTSPQLWVVANPNIEKDGSLLEAKMEAGAVAVLTQPPFEWRRWEAWLNDCVRRGLLGTNQLELRVGVPFISSAGNMKFWMDLSRCDEGPESLEQLHRLRELEQGPKDQVAGKLLEMNKGVIDKVSVFPGLSGLHIMPITPRSKQMVMTLIKNGYLGKSPAL